MRRVVYDPPYLTDHLTKITGMAKKPAICAECGLGGWNWKCAECGCESGIPQGSPGYSPAVTARVARMRGAGKRSLSMHTGQPPTSSPASGSADQPAAASTPTPPADSAPDTLSKAIRHLQGAGAADFTGSARAASLGGFFVVLGWIVVGLSVIGGIALMAITEPISRYDDHHPYVIEGVVVLATGAIQGFVLVMIGSFVQATLEFQSLVGGFFKRLTTMFLP